jgi:hypothetical protein
MEKRINKKIEEYIGAFKNAIHKKITDANFEDKEKVIDVLEFALEYNRLVLEKDDFIKRKRVKNSIPNMNRCNAKRANGEQCTRRRKEECEFCGTHYKGRPHGVIHESDLANVSTQKFEVFAEDIQGIMYYIDRFCNVYRTEDILNGKENPDIMAKCVFENGSYTIPSLGIV